MQHSACALPAPAPASAQAPHQRLAADLFTQALPKEATHTMYHAAAPTILLQGGQARVNTDVLCKAVRTACTSLQCTWRVLCIPLGNHLSSAAAAAAAAYGSRPFTQKIRNTIMAPVT